MSEYIKNDAKTKILLSEHFCLLFLPLFMGSALFAPFAKFLKLNLARDKFFIFSRPIINPFTGFTDKFYETIL